MTKYLIIGSGRWARHLLKSLALARIPHDNWARQTHSQQDLEVFLKTATHIWLAISDSAIPEWIERLPKDKIILHSSGAHEFSGSHSVHPLMSFAPEIYPDAFYSRYAFVTTSRLSREELIANLPNSLTYIPSEQKAFYHAMCVLTGNGSVLLWQKFFEEMQKMGLPQDGSRLYAERIFENLLNSPETALTGPWVRNDQKTLQMDLDALAKDPFQQVLSAMTSAYERRKVVP